MPTDAMHENALCNGNNNIRKSSALLSKENYSSNNSRQRMMSDDSCHEASGCCGNQDLDESCIFSKPVRFIKKSGHCNVSHVHLTDKSKRFIADIFTTGVDLQWRWNLFVFSAAFVISWLIFGLIFWLTSYLHGDFTALQDENISSSFKPCIKELDASYPFTSTFLFSLETQTTIGYGYRVVTEECPVTIIMVVIQSVFGCILDAFMIGLIMAKISRPKKRAETLLFSRNAVINLRDNQLCLMVRVGNLRKSHLVEATIRMQYVYSRETAEGEFIPIEQVDLNLDLKNDSDRLFLVTPQTISHPIDESSPLWDLNPNDLLDANFEIIVILEGMVEATGMTTQARASYLPSEILWGHRFQNMISLTRHNAYKVNFKKFHNTFRTSEVPQQSAKELHESANSSIRSILESGVVLRSKRQPRKNSSNSSSSSSVRSSQQDPSSASDARDSGYTAVEDIQRSNSIHSFNASNKPMTSTTSLSDEADESKSKMKRSDKEERETTSLRSSTNSLIDLSTPGLKQDYDVTEPWRKTEGGYLKKQKSEDPQTIDQSSDGVKLLLMNPLRSESHHQSLPNMAQTEFNKRQIDEAFGTRMEMDAKNTLCV